MKTRYMILWLLATISTAVTFAQEAEPMSSLDSLKNQVSQLQDRVSETEKQLLFEQIWNKRSKYLNIGYVSQPRSITDTDIVLKSKAGVSLSWGKQFYLHRKPLFDMLKFAIDWSWIDLNYANYDNGYNINTGLAGKLHQIDFAMQFGGSVSINPVDHLKTGVYFRVSPTGTISAGLGEDSSVSFGYMTNYNAGIFIAYKLASIGFEYRWGKGTLNNFAYDEESVANGTYGDYTDGYPDAEDALMLEKIKTGIVTSRIYFGFRF